MVLLASKIYNLWTVSLCSFYSTYNTTDIKEACNGVDIVIATAGLSKWHCDRSPILSNKTHSLGKYLESEGHDRADINLPGLQLQMLKDAEGASGEGT